MPGVRQPAVAGAFYPADPTALQAAIERCLSGCKSGAEAPKALIVPHAGYVYSGPVAARAYALLAPARDRIRRVVLIGPSHYAGFRGIALPAADTFRTPLGRIPLDREALDTLRALPQVVVDGAAHAREHSLEVQLPFLQTVLDDFALIPLVTGEASHAAVAQVLELLWNGPQTLVVVSSDLSHYLDYEGARRRDAATAQSIQRLEPETLGPERACGGIGIGGLLLTARRRGLEIEALDLRNSGDTTGPRDRVVGYGAFALREAEPD